MQAKNVLSNFIWRFAERTGAQIVGFIVGIILARLLEPSDYGVISLIWVFLNILGIFVDSGLGNALIQKKDADDIDFSSVFYANLLFCIVLYLILYAFSPLIASFYERSEMTPMIRVLGITLLISGIKGIQVAYVSKKMIFKKFFFATLFGTIVASIIGIWMAYAGFGAWALITQSLTNNFLDTLILWFTVKWRPKKLFSLKRLKNLLQFGGRILASTFIDTIYNNLRSLIIGKLYSSEDLAYYNRGQAWPNLIVSNVNTSIDSVLLPSMSQVQDDVSRLKDMTRRAIKLSTYIMAPFLMGLAAVAEPLTRIVLTEKWMPAVPFIRIFCITYMFYPIHTANLNAIKALGKSKTFLRQEIIKKIVGLIAVFITAPISVMAIGYSLLFTSLANQIINSWPNKKYLHYGYLEQLKDISPGILLAVVMACLVYCITLLGYSDFATLVLQTIMGIIFYIVGSKLLKIDSFSYILNVLKQRKTNKKTA